LEHFGFHVQIAEGIHRCAKINCDGDEAAIKQELQTVLGDFSPAAKGGSKSAGAHPEIDWSKMVKAYDGEVSALPDDKYNMWALVGIANVTETFNDMSAVTHVASVANALNKQKQQSWYTAMQLAAVHDFNYWSLYDPTIGLFSLNTTLTDAEYLKTIKDKTGFTTAFATRAEFEGMVHTKAKMWMVGSGHIAHVQELPYVSWIWMGTIVDDPYKKFMMDVSGQNSANDLWTLLGYRVMTPRRKLPCKIDWSAQ